MSDLKPGPELDALVAEKVMGYEDKRIHWLKRGECLVLKDNWSPSTSIADAWEVVEKMNGLGCLTNSNSTAYTDLGGGWWCDYGPFFKEGAQGDTAPHAICLAALRAVGAIE